MTGYQWNPMADYIGQVNVAGLARTPTEVRRRGGV